MSIICCFLLSVIICRGQENLRFEHFTSENGLSENVVYSIYQDKNGFLWIGTHDGLNRYDGYGFKKFRHNPNDSNSLPDNTIKSICEDGKGNIWLATNAGLCRYDPAKNIFRRVALQNNSNDVRQVLAIDEDELIVKYGEAFSLINTQTLKETNIDLHEEKMNVKYWGYISPLTKDRNGSIYVSNSSWDGYINVWRYDRGQKSFMGFKRLPVDKGWTKKRVHFFFIDNRNNCWIAISGGETIMYSLSGNFTENCLLKPKPAKYLTSNIYEDGDGDIWITTEAGLFFYDYATGKTRRYQPDKSSHSISSDIVHTVTQDKTGIIWIGTSYGLNKLNPLQRKFKHLSNEKHAEAGLFNNFVLGVYPEKDHQVRIHYNYWKSYFSRFNIRTNSTTHYSIQDYPYVDFIKEVVTKNPERLDDSILKKAMISLNNMDKSSGKPNGSLFVDKTNNLWYSAWQSLFQLSPFREWPFNSLIVDAQIYDDEIWLATNGDGLICFHVPTQKVTKYITEPGKKNTISSNDITCTIRDENGNLWIGTKGGGLNYFDRQKKIFEHYTEENGLCNNSIYSMVKDDHGRLWIGTTHGLSCFDPSAKKFRNYFQSDGLVNSEYNRQSACKLPDGTIFMGGMNGIDYFHPDSLINNKIKPQVQITDFKLFDKSISPVENFSLRHNQNFITISFAAMDFSNPSANKFSYKLEGADKDWVFPEKRNFATYSLLPPGSYRFLIKAANSDGLWNEEPITFSFSIQPPWYQTWWFRTVFILAIITAGYFFIRSYVQRKLARQKLMLERKQAIELERLRISTELHDDVGGELSAIRLLSEMKTANISPQQQLSKISSSSAELVQKMNEIVWALNVNNDSLQSLVAYLRRYAVKYLDDLGIACSFEQPGKLPHKEVDGLSRRNIFLLVKEALNNVVKHAGASAVEITVVINNGLQIIVKDNGKGITGDMLQNGTGNGLRNMQQRVKEMNGSMAIKNHDGTTVHFNLPLQTTNTKG
ncbi:MAG: two-component regulator propeller domain-containing protein [Chitinophagaceae bacterium]